MVRPTLRPCASEAPRFAASMMPGPPPVQTTKRRCAAGSSPLDHCVKRKASVRAASYQVEPCGVRADPKNTIVSSTPSASRRLLGSRYSARMRSARASLPCMNSEFRYALIGFNFEPLSRGELSALFNENYRSLDPDNQDVHVEG